METVSAASQKVSGIGTVFPLYGKGRGRESVYIEKLLGETPWNVFDVSKSSSKCCYREAHMDIIRQRVRK